MKKIIAVASLVFVGVCAVSLNYTEVHAEDSCSAQQVSDFKSCVAAGIDACNDNDCGEYKGGVATSDVAGSVASTCCQRSKQRSKKRCIRKQERKTLRARRAAPTALKDFLNYLKGEFKYAKKNVEEFCEEFGYSQLF